MRNNASTIRSLSPALVPLVSALVLGACASRAPNATTNDGVEPSTVQAPYVVCDAEGACGDAYECVFGLCLPACGDGPACVEGEICVDGACTLACSDQYACDPGFTCTDGECATDPCAHPGFWPLQLEAQSLPVVVHFRDQAELEAAQTTLTAVEYSWDIETRVLGFEPPLLDNGLCGPDDRFDVFVWRTWRGGVSDVITTNQDTAWDDMINYLIVDPWGPYGGDALEVTTAHELNHAMHAVHDWNETPIFFEMSAQFVEDQVYDDNNAWRGYLADFQQNADWSLLFNDDYETYYMYGSALYLFYVRDGIFAPLSGESPNNTHAAFLSEVWRNSRNPAGTNEPDFVDALNAILQRDAAMTFLDSVVGFARWRFYTGTRDDGRHFEEGAELPEEAMVPIVTGFPAEATTGYEIASDVMLLGSRYIAVAPATGGETTRTVRFVGDERVTWHVDVVPGLDGSDGEPVAVDTGAFEVSLTDGPRTLIVTSLPLDPATFDADDITAERFAFSLTLQ